MGNGFSFTLYKELLDVVSFGIFSFNLSFFFGGSTSVLLLTADLRTGSESLYGCSAPSMLGVDRKTFCPSFDLSLHLQF